jgi:hypothetical protein
MIEDMETSVPPPPEEGGNRMFLIGAIILGVIFIVSLVSIFALYFLTRGSTPAGPEPDSGTATAMYLADAQQTAEAGGTQTQAAAATFTETAPPTGTPLPTGTPTQSPTPVVFATIGSSETPADTPIIASPELTRTGTPEETAAAGQTAAPTFTRTRTPVGAATALPQTGIGDSAGLPMLVILGGVSMIVIILTRQIRLGRKTR